MKKIKFIRPKVAMSEHSCCDKCGQRPQFRSKNYSLFVCSECANRLQISADAYQLIDLPDNHISQLLPEREQKRPFRPRKSVILHEKLRRIDQSLRAKLTSCEDAEKKQIDAALRSSASLLKDNKRLLKKFFGTPSCNTPD